MQSGRDAQVGADPIEDPAPGVTLPEEDRRVGERGEEARDEPHYLHHPVLGHVYAPGIRVPVNRPDGTRTILRVNSAGIRADREYTPKRAPGCFRILVFGDSHAGGLFQPNERRFSELIERRNPGLEVINFATPGTGTDQQLLAYEEYGRSYQHDLVLLMPFLMNIRRNQASALASRVLSTGRIIPRPKPQFVLVNDADGSERLELRNVPVPEPERIDRPPQGAPCAAVSSRSLARSLRLARGRVSPARAMKALLMPQFARIGLDPFPLMRRVGYSAFPEYDSPETDAWRLMAAILRRFASVAGERPVALIPLVNSAYMSFDVGRSYWDRFGEIADGSRVHAIDVVPYFRKLGSGARACYFEPRDPHLSDLGHEVLASAVEGELRRLDLLPGPTTRS